MTLPSSEAESRGLLRRESEPILLDGKRGLSRSELLDVMDGRRPILLGEDARASMQASHDALTGWVAAGAQIYGASSGVGDFATRGVAWDRADRLQLNVVRSHSCALGAALSARIVRGAMALRASTFSRGFSAVRPRLVDLLLELLNRDVLPVVPSCGSVGASGDPVLLAHVASVLVGEGTATVNGGPSEAGLPALRKAGLEPIALKPREGLAMVNGLDFTLASAIDVAREASRLLDWANAIGALSADALGASPEPFLGRVQAIRGPGPHLEVAARLEGLMAGSRLVGSSSIPQDPYCIRCIPQVHGATLEAVKHLQDLLDREIEAVVDNPLVVPAEGYAYHCGHFHGQSIALAADYTALAVVNLMNVAQARISLLLRGERGLPQMLAAEQGVDNGLMMTETAAASIVGRARALAAPVSIHSMNVSSVQEDHVSMSWEATRRSRSLCDDLRWILAIEGYVASQAAAFRGEQRLGAGTRELQRRLAAVAPPRFEDRPLTGDLGRVHDLLEEEDADPAYTQ